MEVISIAELKPELPGLDSKRIRGVVVLIWPYSSSARQFAFLLGDPDFRRRRKNGQVRVRFSGSSARAIASTGIGIGDEVELSLRGVEFIRDGSVNTPGKSIDWEIEYRQTLASKIIRDGEEFAELNLVNVAPTPAPASPVRAAPRVSMGSSSQWSSPAFLKRMDMLHGPDLKPDYDPFTDDIEDGHAKKRRRRSYRDWNAWTYLARTPSPEKEDADMEEPVPADGSPIRPVFLPATPISPSKMGVEGDASSQEESSRSQLASEDHEQIAGQDNEEFIEIDSSEQSHAASDEYHDDLVRDADYYDLYAGPDEQRPKQDEHVRSSPIEHETNEETRERGLKGTSSPTAIELDGHVEVDEKFHAQPAIEEICAPSDSAMAEPVADEIIDLLERQPDSEIEEIEHDVPVVDIPNEQGQYQMETPTDLMIPAITSNNAPQIVMPPPTLSLLQTDFHTPYVPGLLTPIGKEPSSPNLQPLDSSTLPMPSPFPGVSEGNITSFLDYVNPSEPSIHPNFERGSRPEVPEDEADYIMETSFYSSVSSSRAPAFQPTHESAFTDVRFTFGMDGAAFSRPQTTSGVVETFGEDMLADEVTAAVEVPESAQDQHSAQDRNDILENKAAEPSETFEVIDTFLASSPVETQTSHQVGLSETGDSSPHRETERRDADTRPDVGQNGEDLESEVASRPDVTIAQGAAPEAENDSQADLSIANEKPEIEVGQDHDAPLQDGSILFDLKPDREQTGKLDHMTSAADAGEHSIASQNLHASQVDDTPGPKTQQSVIPEVIDLGSPSEASDGEGLSQDAQTPSMLEIAQEQDDEANQHVEATPLDEHAQEPFINSNVGTAQELLEDTVSSTLPAQGFASELDNLPLGYIEPASMEEVEMQFEAQSRSELNPPSPDVASLHEDIKMESVEESFTDLIQEDEDHVDDKSTVDENSELLIAIPTEGNKIGELEFVTVPDTAPARSTRSKTKMSLSPEKEYHPSPPSVRSRKRGSVAPLSQLSQRTLSPPATRSRSTITPTPTKERFPTSPYSLRSQSKHLSPTQPAFAMTHKTHARKRSTQTKSSAEPSPHQASFTQDSSATDFDFPWTNFGPSQELGALQGKYAHVSKVKDSEEGSVHSEQSLSTMQYSHDWDKGINFSDPPIPETRVREPASTPKQARMAGGDPSSPVTPIARTTRSMSKTARSPFATQLPLSSPKLTAGFPTLQENSSSSHPSSRVANKGLAEDPADVNMSNTGPSQVPVDAVGVAYPSLSVLDQDVEMRSSPPAGSQLDDSNAIGEAHDYKYRLLETKPASADRQPALPMTPDATQHTHIDSQPIHQTAGEKLPLTPQLTQTMSGRLHSLGAETSQTDEETAVESTKRPTPVSKTTPRRNATATDVASPSASPRSSMDSAPEGEINVAQVEKPSVGLSTPIAYYTPLKDLPYFLNRSSTFHSAGSPDILALVITPSSPPTRATKGPKHHTTTLHVTDLSIYPSQTTVQIFRAYAEALPVAEAGDVVLLRAFNVKSLNRHPCLVSADESAWCVWRYGKPLWGKKRGAFGQVQSREEVKGPVVERGEGEWGEVEKLRAWWVNSVKAEMEEKAHRTRSKDKGEGASQSQG